MKKLLALILAVICCFGMFACGEDHTKTLDDAIAILTQMYKDTTVTPADFDVVGSVKVGENTVKVTWSASLDTVKAVKNGDMIKIDVPDVNDAEAAYVLKATVSIDGQKKTKEFSVKLPVILFNPYVAEPAEGQAYKLMLIQVTAGKNLFATHEISGGKYYATTENATEAPDFFAEKADGGYKFYTTINGTKSYVKAYLEGTSKRLKYDAEGTVWYYKADCKAWFTKIDGGEYVLGTYSNFTTFCISESSYMKPETSGVSQFPGNLITPENVDKLSPVEKDEPEVKLPAADSTLAISEIINLVKDMTHNVYSEGKYYVVGEITEIYNEQYGNMKIKDDKGNILTIYGTYSDDGSDRFDAMTTKPAVGDTVKIYGVIGHYNDTPQVKNGWIIEINP